MQLHIDSLLTAYDQDMTLVLELVDLFTEDCPARVAAIAKAIAAGDARALQAAAHSIKGALAALNLEPLVQIARDLEAVGRSGDLTSADPLFARLRGELDTLIAESAELRRTMA